MKKIAIPMMLLALAGLAQADVGVLVELDGEAYTECVDVPDGTSAYDILQKTSLEIGWSDSGSWGRALCMIEGVGSEPAGTACSDWNSYWAMSLALGGDDGWTAHSPVGFDAGGCWNRDYETPSYDGHYCAKDGDVIGFHYTNEFPSGYPEFAGFEEICAAEKGKEGPKDKKILMSSRPFWRAYCEMCGIEYDDTVPAQTLRQRCVERQERGEETPEPKSISCSHPKAIRSLDDPFRLRFSSDGLPLVAAHVYVNGRLHLTGWYGDVSLDIDRGDYLVELDRPGYAPFRKIFRIG